MSEVKNCPFCGKTPYSTKFQGRLYRACINPMCPICDVLIPDDEWNVRTPDLEWLDVGVNNLTKYGCDSATIGYNTALQDIADLIRRKAGK